MRKLNFYIYIIFLLLTINTAQTGFAQDDIPVLSPPVEDTIEAVLDSISKNLSDSAYYDDGDEDYYGNNNDTLYFLLKTDTTSIYDSSIFNWRAVPDSITEHLKNDDAFWYANKDLHEKKKERSESWVDRFFYKLFKLFANEVFRQIMWIIIIGCFIAAVAWFLAKNKMNVWSSSKGPAIVREKLDGEVDDIFTTDLKAEILKAEQKQNYRLAIRFHYLHLLKLLSHHSIIKYTHDATNMEYLTQLYGQPFYKDFFKVTRDYEYAWYGETEVNNEQYKNVVEEFMELYNKTSVSW